MTIRILIVDHEQLSLEGMSLLIHAQEGMRVAAALPDLTDVAALKKVSSADIALVNIDAPNLNISQSVSELRKRFDGIDVVAMSESVTDVRLGEILALEVRGLVRRKDGFATVCRAIRAVHAGKRYFARAARARIIPVASGDSGSGRELTRLQLLTRRELQLLRLIATGQSLRAACATLNVSYKTGDKHKVNLMRKLDIHDRVELARYAIREGLVKP